MPGEESGSVQELALFEKWQSEAYNKFECLAEKLLDELDKLIAELIESKASFADKLSLLANYVGHGQPGRAFLFLERGEFHRWLSGKTVPSEAVQSVIIRFGLADISSAVHEGDSLARVLSLLSSMKATKAVKIVGVTSNPDELWFDPWIRVAKGWNDDGPVLDADLTVRVYNCLKNDNIYYLGQLVQKTEAEMRCIPNFGPKSIQDIKDLLFAPHGARFGMKHPVLDKFNEDLKAGKTGPS